MEHRLAGHRRLAAAAMMLLIGGAQYTIERCFRGHVNAFIGQPRHDLRRRQIGEAWLMTMVENALAFCARELVRRLGTGGLWARVFSPLNALMPALEGAHA